MILQASLFTKPRAKVFTRPRFKAFTKPGAQPRANACMLLLTQPRAQPKAKGILVPKEQHYKKKAQTQVTSKHTEINTATQHVLGLEVTSRTIQSAAYDGMFYKRISTRSTILN